MSQIEQVGDFLLFQNLASDALGNIYRAARVGRTGSPVLLRTFDGAGIDRALLVEGARARQSLPADIDRRAVLMAAETGSADGTPFATYPLVPGSTLADVLDQATQRQYLLGPDQALRITERIAAGLADTEACVHEGEPLVHGFVVPPLVQLSMDGEVRVTGLEHGAALRAQVQNSQLREAFHAYLAPEVLMGGPLDARESVFSLGALMLHLLTGHAPRPGELSATSIPTELVPFLLQCFAEPGERFVNATTAHAELVRLLGLRDYSPTTFSLSFYLHSLLREEIEAPAGAAAGLDETPPPASPPGATGTDAGVHEMPVPARSPRPRGLLWAAGGGALALAAALTGWLLLRGGDKVPGARVEPAAPAVVETAVVPDPVDPGPEIPPPPPGPTPEEVEAQIRQLVEERYAAAERTMQRQFDSQLDDLQQQLAEARERARERAQILDRQRAAEQRRLEAEAAAALRTERLAAAATPAPAVPALDSAAATGDGLNPTPAVATQEVAATSAAPPTVPAPAVPDPEPVAPAARFEAGELVELNTPGLRAPVRTVTPQINYPPVARRMNREATIELRVLVDHNGNPETIEVVSGSTALGFRSAAVDTARQMRWRPATVEETPVRVWIPVTIDFRL